MTPMRYDDDWVAPWRTVEQARCMSPICAPEGVPGTLVMAVTLDEQGWCASCARTVDESHRELRLM